MTLIGADALLTALRDAVRATEGGVADEVELRVHRRRAAVTRYSHDALHQNAVSDEIQVTARAVVGGAVGVASANAIDGPSLTALIGAAAGLARLLPATPAWPGFATPEPYAQPHAFDAATAAAGAGEQAAAIARITTLTRARRMRAAGTHAIDVTEDAVVNSNGVAAYAPATTAYLRALVLSPGSGYAEDLGSSLAALDPERIAASAMETCALDIDRLELAAGDYEAVFRAVAVAELLRILSVTGLGAASVGEGRSFMSQRIGERVTGEHFTLHDDALDPRTLAIPFDIEGTAKRRVPLIEAGVARGPVYDRTSAHTAGTRSTGHAADRRRYQPGGHAANLSMAGGSATRAELIGSVGRGILITRFHYTNSPDPRRATMTGTSRDGTFLIEDGRITRALANVRFTMSALDLFAGIELLGEQRLVRDWWSSNGMGSVVCLAPPMKVRRATITGSSPA